MSNLTSLRKKMGLTQEQLAQWLGVSRGLLNYNEHGLRSLPTKALLQLSRLELLWQQMEKEQASVKGGNNNDVLMGIVPAPGQPQLAACGQKIEKLQQQLQLLQAKKTVLQQQLEMIQRLMENTDQLNNEKEMLWLRMIFAQTACALLKYKDESLLALKARIVGMLVEYEMRRRGLTGMQL